MSKKRRNRGRGPRAPHGAHHPPIHLTSDGVPAATPDAPPVSPVVVVAKKSREAYPWLPARVIAGSIWRGPAHDRVRVDEKGVAAPIAHARRLEPAKTT
ncbi:MAG: hypothetical protein U0229_15675 [Anaeromyxobacter sp.]